MSTQCERRCAPSPDNASAPGTPSQDETIDHYEHAVGNIEFGDVAAPLLAEASVRINHKFDIPGVDLAYVCAPVGVRARR